ncbi:hypothetical protein OAI07_00675 [Akkermansiaceae bacterium]|nr:hypothetical protein [Akkermansiaceae bacterium]
MASSLFDNKEGNEVADNEWKSATREVRSSGRSVSNADKGESRATTRHAETDGSDVSEKSVKKKKLTEALEKAQKLSDLVVSQKGARSNSELTNRSLGVDEKSLLLAELMEASYRLALKSKTPWRNLISVAKVYYNNGNKVKAREVLSKSLDLAIYPNDKAKTSNAVINVFRGMLSLDQFTLAEKAFQNIPNTDDRQKAMVVAASWSAVKGQLAISRRIIAGVTGVSDRDSALVSLAASEAAYEGVSRAMQTAYSISNVKKKNTTYQRIAIARGSLGDYSGAAQAVQQINDEKVTEATNISLVKIRAQAGDLHGSLGAIQYLKNPDVADASLKNLSQQMAFSGRFSNSAFVSKRIIGDSQRSQALESLSVEQAKSGDISGSLSRINAIPSEMIRNRSMIKISGITANNASTGQARNIATMIGSDIQRDRAYKAIAVAAAATGDHTDAFNTIQQISSPDEKALALVSLARTRQKQGDSREAFSMLENAGRFSQYISPGNSLDRILSDMSVAYAESAGESSRSFSLASAITSENQRDKTYAKLAESFARKDLEAAQHSISSIQSEKTKISAEDKLAKERAKLTVKAGDEKKAVNEARKLRSERQKIVFLLEVVKLL